MAKNPAISHLAIIMDGNRRWAKRHGLPTLEGHRRGYEKIKALTRWCIECNIPIVTLYAFSTENWNRSRREVTYLMSLLRLVLEHDLTELDRQGVRLVVIGQRERLAPDLQRLIEKAEATTQRNTRMILQLAISYGGRAEIVQAVRRLIMERIKAEQVTEASVGSHLWTAGIPDPDLLVRTAGEQRLSNFLTWQSVYAEILFIKKYWPDFTKRDLTAMIREFGQRQRRFGK